MTQNSILQQAANRRTGGWQACLRAFLPLIVSLGLILGTPSTMAQEGVASESQMKAAFLVNFPKYVDWPAAAFSQANSPVVVAIFGDEEVVREFYQMIEGGGRREGQIKLNPMRLFHNMSFRGKQMLVIMLTSTAALLLACGAFVAYNVVSFKKELTAKVSLLTEVIGKNCAAAIDFNDPKNAEDTLSALRVE